MAFLRSFLFLVVTYGAHSQNCKWLRPKQEYLSAQILSAFDQLNSLEVHNETCQYDVIELPDIDRIYNFSKMADAALAVRELMNHTAWFYINHWEIMGYKKKNWERFQNLANYQLNQLEGCIPEKMENSHFNQTISVQFNLLEEMAQEKDKAACTRDYIQIEIRRNLLRVMQLSSRIRRQYQLHRSLELKP